MSTITTYTQTSPFKEPLGLDARYLPEVGEFVKKLLRKLGNELFRCTNIKAERVRPRRATMVEFPTGIILMVEVFVTPETVRVEMFVYNSRTSTKEIKEAKAWAADLTHAVESMEAMEAFLLGMGFTASSKWPQPL